jgi:hypothetical protein
MWPLFFLPWAATCISKKLGLHVTLGFIWVHYTYKHKIFKALTEFSQSKIKSSTHNATQTTHDCKTESCSTKKLEESQSQMETDESSCSSQGNAGWSRPPPEEAVGILGYEYNMYAVKSKTSAFSSPSPPPVDEL